MGEPWEGLDLDDSDISSSSSFSLLRRCSLQPPHPPPPPPPQSQSPHHSLSSSLPPPPPQPQQQQPSVSRRAIPGPAGAIQSAMHRNNRLTSPRHGEASQISTQEYIRRVEEDDGEEFSRNPWAFALDILRRDGGVDGTPLRSVKQGGVAERIDKLVAVVKSCKPNGLGDMMATLKDPTDTIGASVHRKVLSTREHGKSIAVGSVLILEKVVAFYSSGASCYLNITRSNVVKVITVDCAVQSFSEAHERTSDVEIPEKTSGLTRRRPGAHFRDDQPVYFSKGKKVAEEPMGKNSCEAVSLSSSRQIENAGNNISKEPIHNDSVNSGLKSLDWFSKFRDESWRSTQPGPSIAGGLARNQEDLDNAEKVRQVRDSSSAPNRTECLESRHAWLANAAKLGSLLRDNNCISSMADRPGVQVDSPAGTSSSTAENLDNLDIPKANDIMEQRQNGDTRTPYTERNLASREMHKHNNPQKRRQPPETMSNVIMDSKQDQEADVTKKQKLEFVSRAFVQEWTDEQLGILDMDED